ncbi:hypothetical protein DICPUDRAFT_83223 [Dictyostelium purpureum]|uniref:Glycoside-hydrolase family GH114 TIM-barrel domain-containing protein n=1 Tax=Dictyostelium purpureum TaxID=5786 RepID=F0ZYX0_DICPU|nr:uncharacterized protein DICPUDRAFT_83223 [Dictyostelium purpureum]EGC30854.1 hypothetical protein DICPUDRAFT_83223 [Dictyostelium purpureum]|eukprot:XP_003292620.1 hypothetical protein DICPUDRAFT_83223 [Dictyostelium purpureum]
MKILLFIFLFFSIAYSLPSNINTALSIGISPKFKKAFDGELLGSNDWLKILEFSSNKKVIIDIFDSYNSDFINENNFQILVQELRRNKVNSIEFSFSFCLNSKNSYKDIIKTFNNNLRKTNLFPENIWFNIESNYQNCYNNDGKSIDGLLGGNLDNKFDKNQEYYEFTKDVLNTFREYGYSVGIKVSKETYNKVFGNIKDSRFSSFPLFYLKSGTNQEFEDYYLSPIGLWTDFKVKQFRRLNDIIKISKEGDVDIYLNSHKLIGGVDLFNGFGSGSGGSGGGSGSGSGSGSSGSSGAQLSGTGEVQFF